MNKLKTGELFRASAHLGFIAAKNEKDKRIPTSVSKAMEKILWHLDTYIINFGQLYQITDDLLDISGIESEIGKPVGSDVRNGKRTLLSVCGELRMREEMESCMHNARHAAGKLTAALGIDGEEFFLTELIARVSERKK